MNTQTNEFKEHILTPPDERKFQVQCDAGYAGAFRTGCDLLSVSIGQRVLVEGMQEVFESVVVQCKETAGFLEIRVLVNHPDWDEPKLVARIHSTSEDRGEGSLRVEARGI